jgi:hypothetical protein
MAITGHKNLREIETYTRAVRQEQLARKAMGQMVVAFSEQDASG